MNRQRGRIGVGIVTCNRKSGLLRLWNSLPKQQIDALIIVNDGKHEAEYHSLQATLVENPQNQGVGYSKNTALRYLLTQNIDHFFLIEDDIYLKDPQVFERYIAASEETGIQHFNFGLHGPYNVDEQGLPRPRLQVNYASFCLPLYPSCVGAFSYYSRRCLQKAGLMDEIFITRWSTWNTAGASYRRECTRRSPILPISKTQGIIWEMRVESPSVHHL